MLRYKLVASCDRPGAALDVRSFDSAEKVVAWIDSNICVLAPEDKATLFADGYLKLPRVGFLILVAYRKPWWAPWAWLEDEGQVIVGAVLVATGLLTMFGSRHPYLDWYSEIWMLFGIGLMARAARRRS